VNANLFDVLARSVADPTRPALETPAGDRLSYADLLAAAGRVANALAALGVRPGDRVAAQVEKSPAALALYLGCLRAGAVYLPLNTGYTASELAWFTADAEPVLFVCDPAARAVVVALAGEAMRVETLDADGRGTLTDRTASAPEAFATVAREPDDLAAILYTSGTTGRSKGAMITHRALTSNALALMQTWRFSADDVLLHALPIYHVHGLFIAANTALLAGAAMLFLPRFEPEAVLAALPRASVMMGVPTYYTRLLARPELTAAAVAHVRLFVSGSAPLLAETWRAWRERTGHAVLERYGMTETGINTSNPYDGERVPGSVGLPLPGVELRVVDPENGAPVGADTVGMIEVRGPNLCKGYWRLPEKTREEFRADGFFVTGDLGRIDGNGYVWIVGRGKDLIITGGLNVYPKEVEEAIDALPGVVESAVVGLPHPDLGEGVTAVVVRADAALDEAAVLDALRGRLARFKTPKRVLFAPELPRNVMGKVQKALLRQSHAALYGGG
jgi:malonyl-CoA/methylmalonyl-CoA synthetase